MMTYPSDNNFNYETNTHGGSMCELKLKFDPENVFDELIGMAYLCSGKYTIDIEKIQETYTGRPLTYMTHKDTYIMTIKPNGNDT